ncbi:hypothetical protein PR048_016183, partial [Dryococelus australis]
MTLQPDVGGGRVAGSQKPTTWQPLPGSPVEERPPPRRPPNYRPHNLNPPPGEFVFVLRAGSTPLSLLLNVPFFCHHRLLALHLIVAASLGRRRAGTEISTVKRFRSGPKVDGLVTIQLITRQISAGPRRPVSGHAIQNHNEAKMGCYMLPCSVKGWDGRKEGRVCLRCRDKLEEQHSTGRFLWESVTQSGSLRVFVMECREEGTQGVGIPTQRPLGAGPPPSLSSSFRECHEKIRRVSDHHAIVALVAQCNHKEDTKQKAPNVCPLIICPNYSHTRAVHQERCGKEQLSSLPRPAAHLLCTGVWRDNEEPGSDVARTTTLRNFANIIWEEGKVFWARGRRATRAENPRRVSSACVQRELSENRGACPETHPILQPTLQLTCMSEDTQNCGGAHAGVAGFGGSPVISYKFYKLLRYTRPRWIAGTKGCEEPPLDRREFRESSASYILRPYTSMETRRFDTRCEQTHCPSMVQSLRGASIRLLDEEHCTLAQAGDEHLYAKTLLGKVKEAVGIAERRMEGARVCEAELVASSSHQTALGRARSTARLSSNTPDGSLPVIDRLSRLRVVSTARRRVWSSAGTQGWGEDTGDPRENPPTSGIVWHDSRLLISSSDPTGNRAVVAGEFSSHCPTVAPYMTCRQPRNTVYRPLISSKSLHDVVMKGEQERRVNECAVLRRRQWPALRDLGGSQQRGVETRCGRNKVRMEQRRNARAGETGDPRENPPTSCIVRHDSHLRKSLSAPGVGIEPCSSWWEGSSLTAQPPWPHKPRARHIRIQFDLGSNVKVLHQRNFMILDLRFFDLSSKFWNRKFWRFEMNFISISNPVLYSNGATIIRVDLRSDRGSSFEPRWCNQAEVAGTKRSTRENEAQRAARGDKTNGRACLLRTFSRAPRDQVVGGKFGRGKGSESGCISGSGTQFSLPVKPFVLRAGEAGGWLAESRWEAASNCLSVVFAEINSTANTHARGCVRGLASPSARDLFARSLGGRTLTAPHRTAQRRCFMNKRTDGMQIIFKPGFEAAAGGGKGAALPALLDGVMYQDGEVGGGLTCLWARIARPAALEWLSGVSGGRPYRRLREASALYHARLSAPILTACVLTPSPLMARRYSGLDTRTLVLDMGEEVVVRPCPTCAREHLMVRFLFLCSCSHHYFIAVYLSVVKLRAAHDK